MAAGDQGDKFILHWIDESRTHRILWMLDLLDLEYDVKVHLRDPSTWRGPKSLFKVHPLGKAPILEIIHKDGREPTKLVESGLIVQYVLKHYDPHNLLTPLDPKEQLNVDYYIHYSEGTLQPLNISLLINSAARKIVPFGGKSVTKFITNAINNGYYLHEWKLNLDYLENKLKAMGTGYFVGNSLTGADIMLSFPIYENIFDNLVGIKEVTNDKRDLRAAYPYLAAWSDKIRNNPSYINISEYMEEKVSEHIEARRRRRRH